MTNILHLIHDDKFFHFTSDLFCSIPDISNRFVANVDSKARPLVHIGGLDLWRQAERSYFSSPQMLADLAWCDCLIVHYLHLVGARMILQAPPRVAVVWSGWGGDYYGFLPGGEGAFLGEETREIAANLRPRGGFRDVVKSVTRYGRRIEYRLQNRTIVLPAIERVDLFSAPIPDDFYSLRKELGVRFKAEYAQLNYGSVEQTFQAGGETVTGHDILVGNSATDTNNHAEVFSMLAKYDLGDRKVIVPLSYGDPVYRDAIMELGVRVLGKRFEPIVGFIPLTDYNALIARCSVAIMNHLRQQALGNIGTMLYKGARVFLDERSSVFQFLKKRGAHVFSTSLLLKPSNDLFEPLPEEQKQENRDVLKAFWGHAVVVENARRLVEMVKERKAEKIFLPA